MQRGESGETSSGETWRERFIARLVSGSDDNDDDDDSDDDDGGAEADADAEAAAEGGAATTNGAAAQRDVRSLLAE